MNLCLHWKLLVIVCLLKPLGLLHWVVDVSTVFPLPLEKGGIRRSFQPQQPKNAHCSVFTFVFPATPNPFPVLLFRLYYLVLETPGPLWSSSTGCNLLILPRLVPGSPCRSLPSSSPCPSHTAFLHPNPLNPASLLSPDSVKVMTPVPN